MPDSRINSSVEIERKYDVPESAEVPTIQGFDSAAPTEHESLHAVYYDTPDGALAANAVALRLRVGGHDDGWHLKMPWKNDRIEHQMPASASVPTELLALVREITDELPVAIVVIDTRRITTRVSDDTGRDVAEIADDLVVSSDLRSGIDRSWREWEVELVNNEAADSDAGEAMLDRIEASLLPAGATPSKHHSKLARAMGRTSLN